jgi:hypothetical protein
MVTAILTIILTAVFFLFLVTILAKEQNNRYFWMEYLLIGACIGGIVIYGYGFYLTKGNILMAVVRAVLATLGMFLGKNEYAEIKETFFMQNFFILCLFWLVHIVALFVTANAFLASIGSKALHHIKKISVWMSKNISVIYGCDENCIRFAKSLDGAVIFVDNVISYEAKKTIEANGWLTLEEGREKIKLSGVKKINQLYLYCLKDEEELNIKFAEDFLGKVEKKHRKRRIKNLLLTLIADMSTVDGSEFQKSEEKDGYDSVLVIDRPYLAAKTLVDHFQPCRTIGFSSECIADKDFHVAIVGFGKVGQSVLRNLYMNGQFTGRKFKATIFDPKYQKLSGILTAMNPELFENFLKPDIRGCEIDAREVGFYEYLSKNNIEYICVCTGNNAMNRELANEITGFLKRKHRRFNVFECSYDGVTVHSEAGIREKKELYVKEMLNIGLIDKIAMEINYVYLSDEDKKLYTKEEAWAKVTYFNRMSCRSAADFMPTYKYITDLNGGEWNIEQLSKLEHLRWSAFYFASGFSHMTDEEFDLRAKQFISGQNGVDHKFHINRDEFTHACLIPWDELPELDKKQNAIYIEKGLDRKVDYQKSDTHNVEIMRKLLSK